MSNGDSTKGFHSPISSLYARSTTMEESQLLEKPIEYTHDDYTVGWICALAKEQTAATAMLDVTHPDLLKQHNDPNTYSLGSVGEHKVVIACLPRGCVSSNTAATVAVWMTYTFPSVRLCLLVGIGSGIPPTVRLGDVVVGMPAGTLSGVEEWDVEKSKKVGEMSRPPSILLSALTRLQSDHDFHGSKIPEYLAGLGQKSKRLAAKYLSDSLVDPRWEAEGTKGMPQEPRVHYGLIASTTQPVQEEATRDNLNLGLCDGRVLCIENEATGLMANFPCIAIRGIWDYADEHETKEWQEPAAAIAAAFAKEVLSVLLAAQVTKMPTIKSRGPSVF
jgi:nucleoside phosphorylase